MFFFLQVSKKVASKGFQFKFSGEGSKVEKVVWSSLKGRVDIVVARSDAASRAGDGV